MRRFTVYLSLILIFLSSLGSFVPISSKPHDYLISVGKRGSIFQRASSSHSQAHHYVHSMQLPKKYPFDQKWLKKKLIPGDIIFFKADPKFYTLNLAINGTDGEEIDYAILSFQNFVNKIFNLGFTNYECTFVHVGIYLGKGLILESSPESPTGVRTLSIDAPSFVLNQDDPEAYKIYRMSSKKLQKRVASISREFQKFCKQASSKELNYSYRSAIMSLFPSIKHIQKSSHLYFPKNGASEPLILDHLFCSYLVAWIIQSAEYQMDRSNLSYECVPALSSSPSSLYHFISSESFFFKEVGLIVS